MWCLPHLKASLGSRFSFLDGFLTISPKKQAATMYSMYAYSTGLQNCKIYSRPPPFSANTNNLQATFPHQDSARSTIDPLFKRELLDWN